ncbi:VOC family protein [Pelagibius sp.]|uniref:VOC family protein n=1 Tax=Pelagibius sp. TaxID=1931238 RepID=UPI003B50E5FB
MSSVPVELDRLDHFVLTVRNVEETCAFYEKVFGMRRVDCGEGRVALHFGRQKINLHPNPSPITPKAAVPVPGSADFCVVTEVPPREVLKRLKACSVGIEEGPVASTGALGEMSSVYFRDPDGNLVEIACYDAV